ncbi:phosphoribulokinase/uridine kinase family protein [Butyrivibrio proteoclasticus B316]|uniref:Phosphoribulokinase/uridine kinase family protein n=1 Tax=Butyrivibrio proteoclasticus (strain ATCC 51982 / DSM 14932 / B316) TaxID=515622 RepID=E0S1J0_BUTPB|nr:nucleoside kinase [Butyrivibrio proteoclasticus]ADL33665.1 phosphoribulokinase/uridine kinase family protein [Butyrivibrio proteoclasticus B316]
MSIITINGIQKEYNKGVTYEEIAKEYQNQYNSRIAAVMFNGKIRELMKTVKKDGELSFITFSDTIGYKTMRRTAIMLLIKAVRDVGGDKQLKTRVEFTIGNGYYCTIKGDIKVDDEFAAKVSDRIKFLISEKMPITKRVYPLDDAIEIFKKQGMDDKVALLKYRRSSEINIYKLGDLYDYFYGYMLPNTSYIENFQVECYHGGLLFTLPTKQEPEKVVVSEPREKLFNTMMLSSDWGAMQGIANVGDLNNMICEGRINEMILVQEALQESRIADIARKIFKRIDVKFVMIAGPSSSGKTSFANRLSIQLRTYGLTPHPISLDNYFVDREKTPLNEDGSYNFECLEALDVERFNQDMTRLLKGERVEMPEFNFVTGKREMNGDFLQLGKNDVLVIEGIHGLNEKMSYALPSESKFKIYISALTTLSIDNHNRIPTTDGRLLRRIVRDARTRGASAKKTISMWGSVRAGEEENIFPFQEEADEMFNSAQIYELAVIKQYAEPLLFNIGKDEPEYYEAKRLLKFLDYFVSVDSSFLPRNSICREFVGGSCFKV